MNSVKVNNGSMPSSSQVNSYADFLTPEQKNNFLNYSINKLVCPLSGKFMLDAVLLFPCCHPFSEKAITGRKVCPIATCGKTFTVFVPFPSLREEAQSFIKIIIQPDQKLKNNLNELSEAISDEEDKKHINEALDVFYQEDVDEKELKRGTKMVGDIMIGNENFDQIFPIFKLMNNHCITVSKKPDE